MMFIAHQGRRLPQPLPLRLGFSSRALALWLGCAGGCVATCAWSGEPGAAVTPEPKVQLTEAERAWRDAHEQVRWGVDPDWPPFSSFDSYGRLVGIDADITRL